MKRMDFARLREGQREAAVLARAMDARTMSGTSPTGPRAFSTSAGSAAVGGAKLKSDGGLADE